MTRLWFLKASPKLDPFFFTWTVFITLEWINKERKLTLPFNCISYNFWLVKNFKLLHKAVFLNLFLFFSCFSPIYLRYMTHFDQLMIYCRKGKENNSINNKIPNSYCMLTVCVKLCQALCQSVITMPLMRCLFLSLPVSAPHPYPLIFTNRSTKAWQG